jgi:hypothetical protein
VLVVEHGHDLRMKYMSFLFFGIALMMLPATGSATAAGMDMVTIQTSAGAKHWSVELASDNESRAKGLMFRRQMAAGSGMLFRFDDTRPIAMWMKNTFIPLDMVFVDQAGLVTHIHRGAVPHSLDIIPSRGPVRFVLEINAGEADQFGLAIGNRLQHPWILSDN